jgi:putative ATP-dependent endonuclease of OLD family
LNVLRLKIRHFRGIDELTLYPRGHAVIVGEPGAGRSDIMSALIRVLHPNSTRWTLDVFDIHQFETNDQADIEVVLGGLGEDLEQLFIRQLEVWEQTTGDLLPASETPDELAGDEQGICSTARVYGSLVER